MIEDPKKFIVARLTHELGPHRRVGLGPGIPQSVVPFLPEGTEWIDITTAAVQERQVELVIVEAVEVSAAGDLALAPSESAQLRGLKAGRWIVASTLAREDGEPRLVRQCRFPVQRERCVNLVVTEMGVIEIDPELGLILREISPGISSDDVRARVRASIHVADDLRLLRV